MLLSEENLRIFEEDLKDLSSRIDRILRREFAKDCLIRFVTIPKPSGCLASLFRPILIGAGIGVIGWWIWDHWALWFHQPYHAYTWPQRRYELIGIVVGGGALGRWLVRRIARLGFYRGWRFRLMRVEAVNPKGNMPLRLTTSPNSDSPNGFLAESSAEFRNTGPGTLAVGVSNPMNHRLAIIHLREDSRLAVTSWATHGFFEQALPKMSGRLVALAREFNVQCDRFREVQSGIQEFTGPGKSRPRTVGATPPDPNATWDRLILQEPVKQVLQNTAQMLAQSSVFEAQGITVPRGILLSGPPGTGKTLIARTMAAEIGLPFFAAATSDLKAGYLGKSGERVQDLFRQAREEAPAVVFIDELDVIAPSRQATDDDAYTREIVGQLLQELDGIASQAKRIFVLAATNAPDSIDSAVRSRFPRILEIPLPDDACRTAILRVLLQQKPLNFNAEQILPRIAAYYDQFSGRDLRSLVERAEERAVGRALASGTPSSVRIELQDFE